MGKDRSTFGWASKVPQGENPDGFVAQTSDGTVRDAAVQPRQDYMGWWDGFGTPAETMVPPTGNGGGTGIKFRD